MNETIQHNDYEGIDFNEDNNSNRAAAMTMTSRITGLLRWCGSLIIVLSAISFLVQGHSDLIPAYRYWIAMGFIILLVVCGLFCAYVIKETKGTRIFFGLAMAFLPVQISQLSGMVYSYFNNSIVPMNTAIIGWKFDDITPVLMVINLLVTCGLAIPLVYAGFSILARKSRRQLSLAFFVTCLLLLLPVRDSDWMALMLAGLLFYLRHLDFSSGHDSEMKLMEGLAARVIIWVPVLIMIGRSFLYPYSFILPVVVMVYLSLWLIKDIKQLAFLKKMVPVFELAGVVMLILVWLIIAFQFNARAPVSLLLLPVTLILFLLSGQVEHFATPYRTVGAIFAILVCYNMLTELPLLAPVISLGVGIALIVAGIRCMEKGPAFSGIACFAMGLFSYVHYAVEFYQGSPWLSSIALGLLVLLAASYIENREKQLLKTTRHYFDEFKAWN